MRIASREKIAGRTHAVAGNNYTFNPAPGTTEPMVCEVADQAAIAVFLDPRNSNLFYAAEPVATELTRPAALPKQVAPSVNVDLTLLDANVPAVISSIQALAPDQLRALLDAEKAGKTRKMVVAAIEDRLSTHIGGGECETEQQAALVLGNDEATVLTILSSISDRQLLAAALKIEQASQAPRQAVVKAINAKA